MKINKIKKNKPILQENQQSSETLAYVGERLKMQKKIAYWNSDEYYYKRKKMFADAVRGELEQLRNQRWAEIDKQNELNKKSSFTKGIEYIADVLEFFGGLLIEPFIEGYKDLKKEIKTILG